jgi:hypothetical protein
MYLHTHPAATAVAAAGVSINNYVARTKLYLDQMGVPLAGSWEEASQTLTISSAPPPDNQQQQQQQGGSNAPAAAAAEEQQQQQLPPEMLLGSPNFNLQDWLQRLQQGVSNRQHIEHAELPLQVGKDTPGVSTSIGLCWRHYLPS